MKETKKGKFYDNEAMAIIKAASNGSKDGYLLQHPGAVYSILKKYKQGRSDFNATDILNSGSGKDYWKKMYSEANAEKVIPSKKQIDWNTPGLKTARVKELSKWFVIIPKIYYKDAELKLIDVDKSHEELRKLSAEIALKDTSEGSQATSYNWSEGKGPRVNHWCVAASNSNYYKRYTNDEKMLTSFFFLIFIKKNKDGSPDWNSRYLYYQKAHGFNEFADKFDKHQKIEKVLDNECFNFIEKISKTFESKSSKKLDYFIQSAKEKARKDSFIKDAFKREDAVLNVPDNLVNKMTGGQNEEREVDYDKIRKLTPVIFKSLWSPLFYNNMTNFRRILVSEGSDIKKINNDVFMSINSKKEGMIFLTKYRMIVVGNLKDVESDPRALDPETIKYFRNNVDAFIFPNASQIYSSLHGLINGEGRELKRHYVQPPTIENVKFSRVTIDSSKIDKPIAKNMSKALQDLFDKNYFSEILPNMASHVKNSDGTDTLETEIPDPTSRWALNKNEKVYYNKKTGVRFLVLQISDESADKKSYPYQIYKIVDLPKRSKNSKRALGVKLIGKSTDSDIEEKIQKASETKE